MKEIKEGRKRLGEEKNTEEIIEAVTVVTTKNSVFRDITPCSPVKFN
jgi:hypothetical protein